MYAPGKVIYSITSGLLKQKKVILITLGTIDQKFIELKKLYQLDLFSKDRDSTCYKQLINLRMIVKKCALQNYY